MPVQEISIADYQTRFSDPSAHVLVDVRELEEYVDGHLPGAINIPMSVFQARVDEIGHDRPVVLVCASGGRSAMAAAFMLRQGYAELYNLVDGTLGWIAQGLPLEQE